MKKTALFLLVLTAILFVDYFVISLVGIFAHLCKAGCEFYQDTFGYISIGIIAVSLLGSAFMYAKKSFSMPL